MSFSFSAQSHPGVRRQANEDSYCARPDLGLFAVADGLGGHAAGQTASKVAVEAIEAFVAGAIGLEECTRCGIAKAPANDADRLRDAVRFANCRIGLLVDDRSELRGMATTLAAVLIAPPANGDKPPDTTRRAVVAHVGDSRVYRWSARGLERLTVDHSWVEEQVRAGVLTAGDARRHPWRNLVTRAIGGGDDLAVDLSRILLHAGDRLLICSDGLSSVLTDEEIGRVLGQDAHDETACEVLVRGANLAGGPDNITVVLVTVGSTSDG